MYMECSVGNYPESLDESKVTNASIHENKGPWKASHQVHKYNYNQRGFLMKLDGI